MYAGISQAEQNLLLLESTIPSTERLYVWCYSTQGDLIASSCSEALQATLDTAFRKLAKYEKTMADLQKGATSPPWIIGSSVGMQWGVTMEKRSERDLVFICGPVFYTMPDPKQFGKALRDEASNPWDRAWIPPLVDALPQVPVMSYAVFSRYVLMVHNTLTGQQLGLDAFETHHEGYGGMPADEVGERNRLGVYQAEQALLGMVRTGDINYQGAFRNSSDLSPGVPVYGKDLLRQMKTSIIVFTTLVSRAAMEGGLSPEIAYSLGDSYIQTAENCQDSGELSALAQAMYHDFIYRVHYLHANPNYSHAIQKCCDYIELSLDRKVSASDLAALIGYTEYYLTEKFKKETGQSVSQYIRDAKIRRAKTLLESTTLSIAEISEKLAFNTTSYFIQSFRLVTGCTPAQYRKNGKK